MSVESKSADLRIIVGEDSKGEFKIKIPRSYKLTFGPNVPYARKEGSIRALEGYALRVYDGDKVVACLCNVNWFRDDDIQLYRVVEKVVSNTVWKSEKDGYENTETKRTIRELSSGSTFDDLADAETPKRKK